MKSTDLGLYLVLGLLALVTMAGAACAQPEPTPIPTPTSAPTSTPVPEPEAARSQTTDSKSTTTGVGVIGVVKDVSTIIKDIVQIAAVIGAAIWAIYRFGVFRDKVARGTLSHRITHRTLNEEAVHFSVTVKFSNSGRVVWTLAQGGETTLHLIKPVEDDQLVEIMELRQASGEIKPYQWPLIEEAPLYLPLPVEPSDTEEIYYEFVLPSNIETILVYSYYWQGQENTTNQRWSATTIYDITREAGHGSGITTTSEVPTRSEETHTGTSAY